MQVLQEALIETLRRYSITLLTEKPETKSYKTTKQNYHCVYQLMTEWSMEIPQDLKDYYLEWFPTRSQA